MDTEFQAQVALVTGASKGIGLACARRLASTGARVIGVGEAHVPGHIRPAAGAGRSYCDPFRNGGSA